MTWPVKEIYPIFYYSKKPDSDTKYIMDRMAVIPDKHKQAASDHYEIIYQKPSTTDNRRRANAFLNRVARWFHNDKNKTKIQNNNRK